MAENDQTVASEISELFLRLGDSAVTVPSMLKKNLGFVPILKLHLTVKPHGPAHAANQPQAKVQPSTAARLGLTAQSLHRSLAALSQKPHHALHKISHKNLREPRHSTWELQPSHISQSLTRALREARM